MTQRTGSPSCVESTNETELGTNLMMISSPNRGSRPILRDDRRSNGSMAQPLGTRVVFVKTAEDKKERRPEE